MANGRNEPYWEARQLFHQRRYMDAFSIYEGLAKAGDPHCQVFIGCMYYKGLGVEKNEQLAQHWFRNAASLGSKEGAFYCGKTRFAVNNYDEAVQWFRKSAAQEYGPALFWLGIAYLNGLGVTIDVEKGIKYLEHAAKTGNFFAQRELAVLMIRGKLGFAKIFLGLALFPYAVIAGVVDAISNNNSDKLMG